MTKDSDSVKADAHQAPYPPPRVAQGPPAPPPVGVSHGPPAPPTVTVSFVTAPSVFAAQDPGSNVFVVSFAFAFAVATPLTASGVRIDSIDTLLVTEVIAAAAALAPIDESIIVFKQSSARPTTGGQVAASGSIVVPRSYFDNGDHRMWTIIIRAKGATLESGQVVTSRAVTAMTVALPVTGNTPPFVSIFEPQ